MQRPGGKHCGLALGPSHGPLLISEGAGEPWTAFLPVIVPVRGVWVEKRPPFC